jgi:hypothetical protein
MILRLTSCECVVVVLYVSKSKSKKWMLEQRMTYLGHRALNDPKDMCVCALFK